jgi:hypothetical protein
MASPFLAAIKKLFGSWLASSQRLKSLKVYIAIFSQTFNHSMFYGIRSS